MLCEGSSAMKVHEFVTEVLAWERKNRATQGSVDELLAMVKNRLLPDPNNVPTTRAGLVKHLEAIKKRTVEKVFLCANGCGYLDSATQCCTKCNLTEVHTLVRSNLKEEVRRVFAQPHLVKFFDDSHDRAKHPRTTAMECMQGTYTLHACCLVVLATSCHGTCYDS
jgi:hypothetical protein